MMGRILISWALLGCLPSSIALGQDMTFGMDEAQTPTEGVPEEQPPPTGEEGTTDTPTGEGGGDVIGDLAAGGDATLAPTDAAPRSDETVEEIYAVQQIYALRINRVELAPSFVFTVNDPYVSHPGMGVALNYWWTNVLAVGLNFIWYQGLETESDLGFHVRRSTRLAIPITEYQLGAHLNFTYVPLYGKFMMFNDYIFQWDAYVVGGVGIMRTRPVPVIDPQARQFDFAERIAFNAGIGIRVFLSRFLSVFAELRDYMYLEQLENLEVGLQESRYDPGTWFASTATLTNNVSVHLGLTIFFPFSFDYSLPK